MASLKVKGARWGKESHGGGGPSSRQPEEEGGRGRGAGTPDRSAGRGEAVPGGCASSRRAARRTWLRHAGPFLSGRKDSRTSGHG